MVWDDNPALVEIFPLQYLAYEQTRTLPNIIVDGAKNESTVLTLSHWPGNTTPEELKADLSAESVFNYLSRTECAVSAQVASNNHFDTDGLVGLYTLLNQDEALSRKDYLLDIASAGDFEVYKERDAARITFVLDAWRNPQLSPLKSSIFKESYSEVTNVLYEELLPRFERIMEKIGSFEKYWKQQDDLLEESEDNLQSGVYKLQQHPEQDLAIVLMPDSNRAPGDAIQRMAIHNRTDCMRVLLMQETNFELYYRYETWVDYQSRKLAPRIDLQELAESLSKQESMDGTWQFSGINDITPTMRLVGDSQSKIPFESFRSQVLAFCTQHEN